MKRMIIMGAMLLSCLASGAQGADTLRLSTLYTTHVIFPTELIYADLSNSRIVAAKIIEQNRNMLAIKAKERFTTTASVSALESSGAMHTYVLVNDEHPDRLVIDERRHQQDISDAARMRHTTVKEETTMPASSSPVLSEVAGERQRLFHLGDRAYDLTFLCRDVFVYRDNSYFVLSVGNGSMVGYDASDATFVIESRRRTKRMVQYERNIIPKGRYGSVSARPGETARIVYCFDKVTLTKDQVLKVYLYETGGQRNLVMTLGCRDVNRARAF